MQAFLNIHQLAETLSMGERTARAWCESHGVFPVNVGQKSRARLRWIAEDVMQAVNASRPQSQPADIIPRKKTSTRGLGVSAAELVRRYGGTA